MAETKQPDDKSWPILGKWGWLATMPLLCLYLHVTMPLANTLLVIYVYGFEGYKKGIRCVGLWKRCFFSNGEDMPAGSTSWGVIGGFFSAVVAAFLTVYFVQWCLGHLGKLIDPRLGREHEHAPATSQKELRAREVVSVFAACVVMMISPAIWQSFDLALHEERTQGVVVRTVPPEGMIYRYTVDGREYAGAGDVRIEEVAIGEAYPKGSPVEVRYSSKHPGHSTLGDPLLFPKQILCAAAVVAGFALLIYFGRKRKQHTAAPLAAAAGDPKRAFLLLLCALGVLPYRFFQ